MIQWFRQPRYNLLDRHIESAIMPTCARNGLGLTVWSPLAQGILTGKYNDGLPEGSRGATSDWLEGELTEENLDKVRQLTQLSLAWVLSHPEISCAITGATRPEHVQNNLRAADIELDEAVLGQIETIFG